MARRTSFLSPAMLLVSVLVSAGFLHADSFATNLAFHFTVDEKSITVKGLAGPVTVEVNEQGYFLLNEAGKPELPVRIVNILLPQGEEVSDYGVNASESRLIAQDVIPSIAPPQESEDGVIGEGSPLYIGAKEASPYPPRLIKYLGTGYYHGYAIASFALSPIQYKDGSLYFRESINLNIETQVALGRDIALRERFKPGFREEVRSVVATMIINDEMLDSYHFDEVMVPKPKGGFKPTSAPSLEGSPVEYLIITGNAIQSEFQRLADWKTAKGVPTVVRTIEWIEANYRHGSDLQETLRFFIRDAYQKWGVKWVLLGGDTDIIPARYAYSRFYNGGTEVPTDLYYSCLDGSWNDTHDRYWGEGFYYVTLDKPDLYPEVNLGRIPSSTVTDVKTVVDKIISYETPVDRSYTDRVLLLAEVLFPVDWKPGDTITLNGADFSEYVYYLALLGKPLNVTRAYETYSSYSGAVPESRQAAIDSMNSGVNIINHIGHGFRFNLSVADASIITYDADALTNKDRYFMLYMLNCTAAAYDYFCLAEHFLKNPNGGAVASIGANRSAFPNASSYYMDDFYDLLFNKEVVHIGEAFDRSRYNRTPAAMASDNVDLWTHYIYTILSDPELPLWIGSVDTLEVSHVSSVGLGKNTIVVTVTTGGSPVDSSLVCLYKGEDDYQYATTNTLGEATFNFTSESPGSISVVVTGRNHARHQSYIVVDPSLSAYINFSGLIIDDDSTGTSFGNGNGVIEAGETISLVVSVENTGSASADSVWGVIRTTSGNVSIEDSIFYAGKVNPGEIKAALDSVRVAFSPVVSDESVVEFSLELHDSLGNVWNDSFRKVVHTPVLKLITLYIDDSPPLGNGNGTVESGEEFLLFCNVKNYGTGTASGLSAAIEDMSGAFVFYDSVDSFQDIAPVSTVKNQNGFHIMETSTGVEHYLKLTITDAFGNTYLDTLEFRKPSPPTNLVFDSSEGADRIEISWIKSTSNDVEKYNVYHSLTSGGPYTLASVDPIDHAVFMDTGLNPSTRYYYVITAIDTAGNESSYSAEYYASTNPPQLEGWPIDMLDWTSSSPNVGDIDGDGDLEVVQGNRYVYAWHHDGVELRDGDSDPQSWGILNTYGLDYVAPVTLAYLDTLPGLDIVGVSYSTKEVYCFNYLGDVLPGWPQTTEHNVRAAAVIGDLDGNGDPEIVAIDQYSVIYAWNADGTEVRDGDNDPLTQGVFYRLPIPPAWHYQTPALCDLDNDGKDEIVVGTLVDSIYALNEDGTEVPGWPVGFAGDVVGSVAVGDVDNNGDLEVVAATKSPGVVVLDRNGNMLSGWPKFVSSYTFFNPSPAIADLTGDGYLEVIVAGSNYKLYIFDYTGASLPGWPKDYSATTYTESSPVVGDIDGDLSMDIVLGDESKYLNAWDVNGNLLDGFPIAVDDAIRGTPVLADLDGNNDTEIILAGWDTRLYVWDLPGVYYASRMDWPMFHANPFRNGQVYFVISTGIGGIGELNFAYQILNDGVELKWNFSHNTGYTFGLFRKVASDDQQSEYEKVASNLIQDEDGAIKYVDPDVEPGTGYIYKLEADDRTIAPMETGRIYVPIARASLKQNYPNPFNPSTSIVFYVPEGRPERVTLRVYNVNGALVKNLVDGVLKPNKYEVKWDGRNESGESVSSGVYFYQLRMRNFAATRKMILLK